MTADIVFGGFKPIKPNSLKWSRSVDDIADTATITIPAICRLIDGDKTYTNINTGQKIKEGAPVELYAGYDGNNPLRFKGFVKRLNYRMPLEIECEGYSYLLRNRIINHRFERTTVKKVVEYLIAGTPIRLSDRMPDSIVFEPVTFRNYTAIQVLEFLKEKYLLTVCFFFDEIYVGWRATFKGNTVKLRLNWNVAEDGGLMFNTYEGSNVHIELVSRSADGHKKKKKASNALKPGDVKNVNTLIQSEADKQAAANDLQLQNEQIGFRGNVTCFLFPVVNPGDTIQLIDAKYTEKNGSYFTPGVSGNFSTSGGRQGVKIDFKVNG